MHNSVRRTSSQRISSVAGGVVRRTVLVFLLKQFQGKGSPRKLLSKSGVFPPKFPPPGNKLSLRWLVLLSHRLAEVNCRRLQILVSVERIMLTAQWCGWRVNAWVQCR